MFRTISGIRDFLSRNPRAEETLSAFYECDMHVTPAAKMMNMHPQALNYWYRKIFSHTGFHPKRFLDGVTFYLVLKNMRLPLELWLTYLEPDSLIDFFIKGKHSGPLRVSSLLENPGRLKDFYVYGGTCGLRVEKDPEGGSPIPYLSVEIAWEEPSK